MPATRPTLGVSVWPDFEYDAEGATTLGVVGEPDPSRVDERGNPLVHLCFDVNTFEGPPVMGSTTKVFGVPLPPGIRIDIVPLSLEGWLNTHNGECNLDFDAEFRGSIFGEDFIKLPPMQIRSPLTTGDTKGGFKTATGSRFTEIENRGTRDVGSGDVNPCAGGRPGDLAELVGIARVPKVTGRWDWLMNALLLLPSDALAVLPCRLRVYDPNADADDEMEKAILKALNARFEREVTSSAARGRGEGDGNRGTLKEL